MAHNMQTVTNLCLRDIKRSKSFPHTSQLRLGCFHDSNNYKHFLLNLTLDHVVLGDALSPGHPVGGDVLDALLEHGPDPDAEVGRHNVHQPEPGEALELVDVQLK